MLTDNICRDIIVYVGSEIQGAVEDFELMQVLLEIIDKKCGKRTRACKTLSTYQVRIQERFTQNENIQLIEALDQQIGALESCVSILEEQIKHIPK